MRKSMSIVAARSGCGSAGLLRSNTEIRPIWEPGSQQHNLNTAAMAFRVIKQRREARRAAKLEEIFTVRQDKILVDFSQEVKFVFY